MEIVQVAGLYPPHLGGEELVVQNLAELQAHRHRVTVYTSDIDADAAPRRHDAGGPGVVRDRGWRIGNTPVIPRLFERLMRHRPRPDVVHVHAGLAGVPETVWLAARLRGVPYVAHVHLLVRPSSPAGRLLLPAYQRLLLGRFLRGAARVICLTGPMREAVTAEFGVPPARVRVVPNGVDLARFRPGCPGERAARELLFVGRLTAQKNVALAVDAMAHLPGDVSLRIVGDGDLRHELARGIATRGLSNVDLVGRLVGDDLAGAYRRATAVLMPSSHEGMPLVLLEAMAAGAPVVCAPLPELLETGGDAVVPVHPLTAPGLAAVVSGLLRDTHRREALSRAAVRRAAGHGWSSVARAVESVYAEVVPGWVGTRTG